MLICFLIFYSALASEVDEDGLRHILLCRVILGNMEVVCPGSKQYHPSSQQFDSGVDNLVAPRRYTVWSAYMNSHIFPSFIISFKEPCLKGKQFNVAYILCLEFHGFY